MNDDATLVGEGASAGDAVLPVETPASEPTRLEVNPPPQLDRHSSVEEEAVRRLRDRRARETAVEPPADPVEPQVAPEPVVDDPETGRVQQARDDKGRFASPNEITRYRVKINGVEQEVSAEELIRGYQLAQASTRRFEEAKRLHDEAMAVRQQAAPQQPAPQQAPTPQGGDDDAELAEIAKAFAYGTEAEIRAAELRRQEILLRKMRESVNAPAVDPNQIAAEVYQTFRRQTEAQTDYARFRSEFEDVAKDPDLEFQAFATAQRIMAEDLLQAGVDPAALRSAAPQQVFQAHEAARMRGIPVRSRYEVFSQAGQAARSWRDGLVTRFAPPPSPQQQQAATMAARAAAKAGASSLPTGLNASAPRAPEPRVKTPRDIVNEERRARGQLPL